MTEDVTAASQTLPSPVEYRHGKCATHKIYALTCDTYDWLVAECGNRCQICGFPAADMPQKRLYIDHDYRGNWAVRDLLCIRCNSGIGEGHQNPPASPQQYLENAWFRRLVKERGISADPRWRPPAGATILDHFGTRVDLPRAGVDAPHGNPNETVQVAANKANLAASRTLLDSLSPSFREALIYLLAEDGLLREHRPFVNKKL